MTRQATAIAVSLLLLGALGCGKTNQASDTRGILSAQQSKYHLASEPTGALAVKELLKTAQDDQEVVVAGRIGGGIDPWIEGRAAFILVDPQAAALAAGGVEICSDEECSCLAEHLDGATVVVKFVDENGKTLPIDARELLGVKVLQNLVVKGKAKRIDGADLTIQATGVFVRM
jgi:hypothetical protein